MTTENFATDSAFDSVYVKRIMNRHSEIMKKFQVAEYSEKLGSVLKKNGKAWQHIRYKQGDLVFVQLQNRNSWSGPIKVLAQNGGDI